MLQRKHILLDNNTVDKLKIISGVYSSSISYVIREAIKFYLEQKTQEIIEENKNKIQGLDNTNL